jgi:hypothetical protein
MKAMPLLIPYTSKYKVTHSFHMGKSLNKNVFDKLNMSFTSVGCKQKSAHNNIIALKYVYYSVLSGCTTGAPLRCIIRLPS